MTAIPNSRFFMQFSSLSTQPAEKEGMTPICCFFANVMGHHDVYWPGINICQHSYTWHVEVGTINVLFPFSRNLPIKSFGPLLEVWKVP